MLSGLFSLGLTLSVTLVPPIACAQEAYEADLEYQAGQEAKAQGRDAEAVAHFSRANRLHPTTKLTCLLALSLVQLKRVREAFNLFQELPQLGSRDSLCEQARERLGPLRTELAIVRIWLEPRGAELTVDGEAFGHMQHASREIALRSEAGPHTVTLRATLEHYRAIERDVEITSGRLVEIKLALEPCRGKLHITSTPPGATVRVEGQTSILGQTPLDEEWPEGPFRILIESANRITALRAGVVRDHEQLDVHADLTRSRGLDPLLLIRSLPAGADVYVDQQLAGRTPLTLPELDVGRHALRLALRNHEPWSTQVELIPSLTTLVRSDLEPIREPRWPGWRWVGYGAGAAAVAAGAVTGALALHERSAFFASPTRSKLDQVKGLNRATDILLGAGMIELLVQASIELLSDAEKHSRGAVESTRSPNDLQR